MIKKIKGSKTVIEFGDEKLELDSMKNSLIEENYLTKFFDKVYSIELIPKEENNDSKNQ